MSATEHLIDVFTRHQIFVQRLAGGEVNRVTPLLDQMLDDIALRLAGENSEIETARIIRLSKSISEIVSDSTTEISEQAIAQMKEIAEYEADFTQRAVQQVVNAEFVLPSANQILASATEIPMALVSGKKTEEFTLDEIFDQFSSKKSQEIGRIAQSGFVQGRSTQEVMREIRRVVNTRTKQQLETVIRTSTNHMSNVARNKTIQANSDVIDEVKWISTLDGRTSNVCFGRDSKVFPIDSGPRPPAHHGCRSTVIPVVGSKFAIPGFDGERASMNGPVKTSTTYNSWLKRQPKAFQYELLGKTKARLFRSGGLSLDKFTDPRGITYTIQQLRRLEPMAFDRAGLF